jgi:hypothetical protein
MSEKMSCGAVWIEIPTKTTTFAMQKKIMIFETWMQIVKMKWTTKLLRIDWWHTWMTHSSWELMG